jgi:hypothetical protein
MEDVALEDSAMEVEQPPSFKVVYLLIWFDQGSLSAMSR